MTAFPILAVSFFMNVVAAIFVLCAVVLILAVLVQKGKGGGLSGAFGGGMAGGILGSKTGDFLTWLTIGMVGVFLVLSVIMAKYYKPGISNFEEGQPQQTQQSPAQQPPAQQPPVQPPPVQPPVDQQDIPAAADESGSESTDANLPGV